MRHSANLDLLRTFAISAVLVDHLALTFNAPADGLTGGLGIRICTSLGQMGVLAFFVHTSLVLMYSLERLGPAPHLTARFYIRRALRIYPLAIFAIFFALALHIPSNTWWSHVSVIEPRMLVSNLLLLQNVAFFPSVLDPLWSLPFEVEMYLVLPALFFLATRRRGAVYIGTLLAVAIPLCAVFRLRDMQLYVPCFVAGVLCYALQRGTPEDRERNRIPAWLWAPFLVVLGAGYCLLNLHSIHKIPWTGWLICLILTLALGLFRDAHYRPLNVFAARAAQYSYGAYLLHVPALYLVFRVMRVGNTVLASALFFAITAAASIAAFHAIESPCIHLGRRLSSFGAKGRGSVA